MLVQICQTILVLLSCFWFAFCNLWFAWSPRSHCEVMLPSTCVFLNFDPPGRRAAFHSCKTWCVFHFKALMGMQGLWRKLSGRGLGVTFRFAVIVRKSRRQLGMSFAYTCRRWVLKAGDSPLFWDKLYQLWKVTSRTRDPLKIQNLLYVWLIVSTPSPCHRIGSRKILLRTCLDLFGIIMIQPFRWDDCFQSPTPTTCL